MDKVTYYLASLLILILQTFQTPEKLTAYKHTMYFISAYLPFI